VPSSLPYRRASAVDQHRRERHASMTNEKFVLRAYEIAEVKDIPDGVLLEHASV
jgi:hypothetical protein